MRRVHARAAAVAAGNISVMIVGETGCGKEIVAEIVHRRSPRRDRPFLRLNCAALSDGLVTSELFGHEKGAFTGASQTKRGLLEAANGGTVFLDEIAEMPLTLQTKLLRVIEDREITPVGSLAAKAIDIRFVSATHRNLEQEIDRGTFRHDLYYRLNGATIAIPPLRDRRAEIEPLALYFADRAANERGLRRRPSLAPEALQWILSHQWPGNVRELRNAIARGVLLCDGDRLTLNDIRAENLATPGRPLVAPPGPRPLDDLELRQVTGGGAGSTRLGRTSDITKLAAIKDALEKCGGNQTRAAKLLQISRGTLVSRLTEYGFPRPKKAIG
jgi:two-component system, NtrC family, response regulator AtoC